MARLTLFFAICGILSSGFALQMEFVGEKVIKTGHKTARTEFGGISALTYNAPQNVFYALSDDKSVVGPARFYTLSLTPGFTGFTEFSIAPAATIMDGSASLPGTQPWWANSIDPEGIAFDRRNNRLYFSSERDQNGVPSVNRMTISGEKIMPGFTIPPHYKPRPGKRQGVRNNLGFESLTLTMDGTHLVTATENALVQDGPIASKTAFSPSRILVALNSTHYLAMERSYAPYFGNEINFYTFSFTGATNVLGREELYLKTTVPVWKTPVLKLSEGSLGLDLDNTEAATLGPMLNGKRTLILASDNNFSRRQKTQFLLFTLTD